MQQLAINQIQRNEDNIAIVFNQEFDTDDLTNVAYWLLELLPTIQLIETISGADRANFRLIYQQVNVVMNLDVCSQSCWLEAEIPSESDVLSTIFLVLTSNKSNG
ncbi:DUF3630 family protein [Colwellia sp. MEBiC06753]